MGIKGLRSDSVSQSVFKRVRKWIGPEAPLVLDFLDFSSSISRLPPSWRMHVLRTFLNGWCTSFRISAKDARPCIFGCVDASDRLGHYLSCVRLLEQTRLALQIVIPSSLLGALGLRGEAWASRDSKERFGFVVFASLFYHSASQVTGPDGLVPPERIKDLMHVTRLHFTRGRPERGRRVN